MGLQQQHAKQRWDRLVCSTMPPHHTAWPQRIYQLHLQWRQRNRQHMARLKRQLWIRLIRRPGLPLLPAGCCWLWRKRWLLHWDWASIF